MTQRRAWSLNIARNWPFSASRLMFGTFLDHRRVQQAALMQGKSEKLYLPTGAASLETSIHCWAF